MTTLALLLLLIPWPTTPAEWQHELFRLNQQFVRCMTGPDVCRADWDMGCTFFDRNQDGCIDLMDYAVFQRCGADHLMRCKTL